MEIDAEPDATADLRRYLSVLRRRRLIILATTVAAVVVALVLSFRQEAVYQASVQLLLGSTPSETVVANQAAPDSQRQLTNEIAVIESDVVRRAAEEATNRRIQKEAVSASVATQGSDVIRLSARADGPQEAADLANAYARTYVDWRRQQRVDDLLATGGEIQSRIEGLRANLDEVSAPLTDLDRRLATVEAASERAALIGQRAALADQLDSQRAPLEERLEFYRSQLDELQLSAKLAEGGGLRVLSQAEPPERAASPRPERDALVALAVGLMLGIALSFIFEFLDDSIKDRADLEEASGGLPVLAAIPKLPRAQRDVLISAEEPTSIAAEAYRALRTSLGFLGAERQFKIVQVTSAAPDEGKTTTVANLAVSLAMAGQRTVAVCCDLRQPRLHELLGGSNDVGLTTAMLGDAPALEVFQTVRHDLALVASGAIPPNPSELLGTRRAEQVVQAAAAVSDMVLLDCPPVLPVTDALVVSRMADATILVAAANRTSKRQLRRALELLNRAGAPVMGTVLTEVTGEDGHHYRGSYATAPPRTTGGRGRNRRSSSPESTLRPAPSR